MKEKEELSFELILDIILKPEPKENQISDTYFLDTTPFIAGTRNIESVIGIKSFFSSLFL